MASKSVEKSRPTLVKPPPDDPSKSPIENLVDITELAVLGPDIFTNTHPPWHPPSARGIYGGAVIAMCLAAAQRTLPDNFVPHSCHCYFVLAGSAEVPILFHVERVRDGRSFATRTVQARQRGRAIFTMTGSFARDTTRDEGGDKEKRVEEVKHAMPIPVDPTTGKAFRPPSTKKGEKWVEDSEEARMMMLKDVGPYQCSKLTVIPSVLSLPSLNTINRPISASSLQQTLNITPPVQKKTVQWIRTRGKISTKGHAAHLNALAYLSDSWFIGTVSRIHKLWRFPFTPAQFPHLSPSEQDCARENADFEGVGRQAMDIDPSTGRIKDEEDVRQVGMMVSLDHSIYFHEPRRVRADEWMLAEMESPWAGDGRGLVVQRIFDGGGVLLATCVQEGVMRLKQPGGPEPMIPKL